MNEYFDALPTTILKFTEKGWREQVIVKSANPKYLYLNITAFFLTSLFLQIRYLKKSHPIFLQPKSEIPLKLALKAYSKSIWWAKSSTILEGASWTSIMEKKVHLTTAFAP